MDTKAAKIIGTCIILAAAIVTFVPRFLLPEKIKISKIEYAGSGGQTLSLEANEAWPQPQATLEERFVVVRGKGPFGLYTQWIPRERLITMVRLEKVE